MTEVREGPDGRKYTVRFNRGYHHEVYDDKNRLCALTSREERLSKIGPWRQAMTKAEWDGGGDGAPVIKAPG